MGDYYPPEFKQAKFHCVYCGVFSLQTWSVIFEGLSGGIAELPELKQCRCFHCKKLSYWYQGRMVIPSETPVPTAHIDMPEECKTDYDEARAIVAVSPRSAAALLRLALQKMMPILGEKGKNINDDIGALVKKGLPVEIQQALDVCRVVGNNAVHPGEIEINDTPEIAHILFEMMNLIIDDRISRPKKIREAYNKLPEGARKAIESRDAPKS